MLQKLMSDDFRGVQTGGPRPPHSPPKDSRVACTTSELNKTVSKKGLQRVAQQIGGGSSQHFQRSQLLRSNLEELAADLAQDAAQGTCSLSHSDAVS